MIRKLPLARATSMEKLVLDVIAVVEGAPSPEMDREARIRGHREHIARCIDGSEALDWSDFERPQQGKYEVRAEW